MVSSARLAAAPRPAVLLGLVVLGGALGAGIRAALVLPIGSGTSSLAVPAVTLVVNVVGSLLLGVVIGTLGSGSPRLRAFLGTGLLGGFTTYSAFAVQVARLADRDAPTALIVAAASLALGVLAAVAGLALGRRFARDAIADPADAE